MAWAQQDACGFDSLHVLR